MDSYKYMIDFSKKMFRANKKRNVLIIVTIALSIFFSSAMLYFQDTLEIFYLTQNLKAYGTKAEAEYTGVSYDDYLKMQDKGEFTNLSYGINLFDTPYEQYNSSEVHIRYYEEQAAQWAFDELICGEWPMAADEAVVDSGFCQNMKEVSVGDYFYIEALNTSFRVCGLTQGKNNCVYVSKAGWDAEEQFDKENGHIYVRLDDIENADMVLKERWEKVFDSEPVYMINYVYQRENESGENALQSVFYRLVSLFMIFIITLTSVYSVYYFAMLKDLKIYSLLRLQGMQKKQIQTIMRFQGGFQFLIGAPVGVILSLVFNRVVFSWIIFRMLQTDIVIVFKIAHYVLPVCVCLAALILGISKPVRIMTKLSAIQSMRFSNVRKIRKKNHGSKRFSLMRMAWRNIQRNKGRSILVSLCTAMVLAVFVVTVNLVESVSNYYDDLYAVSSDFVVGSEWLFYMLSHYGGLHTDEEMKEERLGFGGNDDQEYLLKIDKSLMNEINEKCIQDNVNFYYFNYAVINDSVYIDRIRKAINDNVFCVEQRYLYEIYLERNENWVPQIQYYTDFSRLEDCNVKEGKLDQKLFETGEYAVLIYDEELQSEPLFHAGDKMVIGSVDSGIATTKAFDSVDYSFDWNKSGIENSVREVEIMAVVDRVPEMYVVTGFNACFLSLNSVDAVSNDNITLYGITIDSEENGKTENTVKSIIQADVTSTNEIRYLSEAVKKEEKRQITIFYIGIGGGISIVLCMIAFMNLINNCMLGLVERKEELMVFHAVGMEKRQMIRMLRIENCMITGSGAFLGYCAGAAVSKLYILNEYGNYYNFSQYVKNDKIPGIVLIGIILLLSIIIPNNKMKIGEREKED